MISFEAYKKALNKLTGEMFRFFLPISRLGENIAFSPYSILTLLLMAAYATGGDTRENILKVLSVGEDLDSCSAVVKELEERLSETTEMMSSNAVCVAEYFKDRIVPSFARTLYDVFKGELFCSRNIVGDVNAWVREKTGGIIDGALDESAKDMILCLLNAVAFQADWDEPYNNYQNYDEEFTNDDGSVSKVPMLYSCENEYVEDDAFTGFVKPYSGGRFSYMALLPKDKTVKGLYEAAAKADLSVLFESRSRNEVHATMPEFKCDFSKDLRSFCRDIMIRRIFTASADFSPLADEWLRADALLHKAHIEVDRHGTRAEALSAMFAVAACAEPEEFRKVTLDRPFIWAVMQKDPAIPVFTGVIKHLGG